MTLGDSEGHGSLGCGNPRGFKESDMTDQLNNKKMKHLDPHPGTELASSVAQSCPTLCDPMNRSTPGLPSITNSWILLKLMPIEWAPEGFQSILERPPETTMEGYARAWGSSAGEGCEKS